MLFAASAFAYISERSVQIENPAFLAMHVGLDRVASETSVQRFSLTRASPFRHAF